MDWFQSKTGQIIALVSIVGTLAGFGYTGATYVNRLEKEIDNIEVPDVTDIKTDVATIKAEIQNLQKEIEKIEEADKNPLAG